MKYLLIVVLLLAGVAAAHTVTMNLALNVGGTNNTIRVNDTTYSGNTANSSVVLLMHLDNSTLDSSAYGNNGVANGPNCTGVTGHVNNACSFDGIDDFINVSYSGSVDWTGNNITVAAWINTPTPTKSYGMIVTTGGGVNDGYELRFNATTGKPEFFVTGTTSPDRASSDMVLDSSTWYHLVGTYNGSVISLYINGALDKSVDASGKFIQTNRTVLIGRRYDSSSYNFNGTIDEVVIYNRSLSAEEVYNLYTYGLSEPTSLVFTSKNYISSSQGNTTAALVTAGTLLNMRFNNSYNSTHYLLQATHAGDDNRFLFAVTNGSYTDVENKLSMIDTFRMVSSTFGNFITTSPIVFPLFIRLEYTNIDIDSSTDWSGTGQLRIRNSGVNNRNIPNLTLEVVR